MIRSIDLGYNLRIAVRDTSVPNVALRVEQGVKLAAPNKRK